jgi:hypothetical protein
MHQAVAKHLKMSEGRNPGQFWCDETGYMSGASLESGDSALVQEREIVKKAIILRANGFGMHCWFVFRSSPRDSYKSIDNLNRCRPVLIAHNTLVRNLRQTVCRKKFCKPSVGEVYQFQKETGSKENILVMFRPNVTRGQFAKLKFGKVVKGRAENIFGTPSEFATEPDGTTSVFLEEHPLYVSIPSDAELLDVEYDSMLGFPYQSVFRKGKGNVEVPFRIFNPFSKPISVGIALKGSGAWRPVRPKLAVTVPPAGTSGVDGMFVCDDTSVSAVAFPSVSMTVADRGIRIETPMKFSACEPISGREKLFADLSDRAFVTEFREGDVDRDMFWNGPSDLSAKLYGYWNGTNLVIRADVVDDVHFNNQVGYGMYECDSLQLVVKNDAGKMFKFGICMATDGKGKWYEQYSGDKMHPAFYDVRRKDGVTSYVIALPMSDMDVEPRAGEAIGISAVVNDNDSRCRKTALVWGEGILDAMRQGTVQNPFVLE